MKDLIERVSESAHAGHGHFKIWFALRGKGKALPEYLNELNDQRYREFFRASAASHYKLLFIELGCLFDPDPRAASFRALKGALIDHGLSREAGLIESGLSNYSGLVPKLLTIRSKLIAHKEVGANSEVVHRENGVTPDQISKLLVASCNLINEIVDSVYEQGWVPHADSSNKLEEQTLSLLAMIRSGRS